MQESTSVFKIFIIILMLVAQVVDAQEVRVLEVKSREPVPFATIYRIDLRLSVNTNQYGVADISAFNSMDTLVIRHSAFISDTVLRSAIETELFLIREDFELDAVVISSSGFIELKSELAQRITSIDIKNIEFNPGQTSADILAASGQVFVQKSQLGGGSPVIRGFEANRILLVVDGVRLNNAIYRSGHLHNGISVSADLLKNIEILYGPGSVIYGSDAVGGVVHYHSKDPEFSLDRKALFKGSVTANFASANFERGMQVQLNSAVKNIASLTGVSYVLYDDLRKGDNANPFYQDSYGDRNNYVKQINGVDSIVDNDDPNKQVYSGYKQLDLLQKLSFITGKHWTQKINFQYSRSSDIPRYDRLSRNRNGLPQYAEWYYGPQERLMISLGSEYVNKKMLFDNARINVAYQKINESRHTRNYRSPDLNHRSERVNVYSVNVDLKKQYGISEVRYGAEYTYNDVRSSAVGLNTASGNSFAISTRYPSGGSYMKSAAIYLNHKINFNERLLFTQGVRLNYFHLSAELGDPVFFPFPDQRFKSTNSAWNGSLGVVYFADKHRSRRITTNLSKGFRAPNVDDLSKVFESKQGSVVVPNPDVKPESVYTFDILSDGRINHSASYEVGVFLRYLRNVIGINDYSLNGLDSVLYDGVLSNILANQNRDEALVLGFSAGIKLRLSDRMRFIGNTNYTYGRVLNDSANTPLDHIPPLFGKLALSYDIEDWNTEFYVLYNGWKRKKDYNIEGEDNFESATENGMPAWITYNLKVKYEVREQMDIIAAIENIADYNYRVFASGINGPGISFIFSLRKRF